MLSPADIIDNATRAADVCARYHLEPEFVTISTHTVAWITVPLAHMQVALKGHTATVKREFGRMQYLVHVDGVDVRAISYESDSGESATVVL